MKLSLFLLFISISSFSKTSTLECVTDQGKALATGIEDDTENYSDFMQYCSFQIFHGDLCFTGKRSDTIELLKSFSSNDIWGGEESIINVHYVGRNAISYEVWDGPGESSLGKNRIYRCE